jgi:F-type H+-transporting ATPase subunit a
MVPGIETSTSEAALTFFISFSTVVGCMLLGFTLHSARYFSALLPSGTPFLIMPFILLIELVSYLARAISLGMRLFANMFAGHSLFKILFTFAWIALMSAMPIPGFFIIALMLVIALMELGIAYLQSYVLGALSFMYYEDVVNPAH